MLAKRVYASLWRPTTSQLLRCQLSTSASVQGISWAPTNIDKPKVLLTGSLGQLGTGMARLLRNEFGKNNVIMSDILRPSREIRTSGPFIYADVLDFKNLQEIIVTYDIDWIIHFSALLSAVGETNVPLAMRVNIEGMHNVLELAKQYRTKIFIPSTIGAFGPDSPRDPTPDITIQRPRTIYGVSKVHAELMGEYYQNKFGVDFRCLRFPGVISSDTEPGGGTTDYAVQIFHDTVAGRKFKCFLSPETRLPMMYIDDCLRSILTFMQVPQEKLQRRTYNVTAMSFSPRELVEAIRVYVPELEVHYQPDAIRQSIADSWPRVFDDSGAREHWNWSHKYDLHDLVRVMFEALKPELLETSTKS